MVDPYEVNLHVFDKEETGIEDLIPEQIAYRDREIPALLGIKIVAPICLTIVMFGVGCNFNFKDSKERMRKPVSAIVAGMCQFALMPLLGFSCIYIFGIHEYIYLAGGTILLACSPGALVSIYFTLMVHGDFILSSSMTTALSVLALGITPLCVFVYGQAWQSRLSFVHYGYLVLVIAVMLVPLLFGAILRAKLGKKMETVAKFLYPVALLLAVGYIVITIICDPQLFFSSWRPWVCAWLYSFLALVIGYFGGFVACLTHSECRTVAYEAGCQNVPLAVTAVALTLFVRDGIVLQMMIFPVLYEIFLFINCLAFVGLYRCCMSFRLPKQDDTKRIVRTPSTSTVRTVGSGMTSATGVSTPGSITTSLPPGSYVNYALDLNNSYNKSFAPVVKFDPDTQDIGNKYGHQTVQTPDGDDGGFGEREEKVIVPRKYRGRNNAEREGVEMEAASPQKTRQEEGDSTPVKRGNMPQPLSESTPARPPLPRENLYSRQPGYTNFAMDEPEDTRPAYSPRSYDERPPERPPLPRDYSLEPKYDIPDHAPKHQVVLDPRRDIHSAGNYPDRRQQPSRSRGNPASGYQQDDRRRPPQPNGERPPEIESEV